MKILFTIRSLENGGAERQLVLLANLLARRGHDVAIAVLYPGGVHEANLDRSRVRLIDLEKRSPWNLLGFAASVARLVRCERPDVIHGYLSAGNVTATLAGWAYPGAKLVWGIRDSKLSPKDYGLMTRLTNVAMQMVARHVDLMIFNSESGRAHWEEAGLLTCKAAVVPNGIDTREFAPDAAARAEFRRLWQIPEHDPVVGMVARFDPAKDYDSFLKAAALVARQVPQARFVCLGGGLPQERDRLQALAASLGIAPRVLWPKPTPEMRGVYNALDVFCLASHAEGFPNVVAEAMACGKPCVVSDAGDAARVVGNTGEVVPVGDHPALAEAILRSLRNTSPVAESVRRRVLDSFTVEALAENTEIALADGQSSPIAVGLAGGARRETL